MGGSFHCSRVGKIHSSDEFLLTNQNEFRLKAVLSVSTQLCHSLFLLLFIYIMKRSSGGGVITAQSLTCFGTLSCQELNGSVLSYKGNDGRGFPELWAGPNHFREVFIWKLQYKLNK